MRYEYRLLQLEMHRLVRTREFQDPVSIRNFWAFAVGVYGFWPSRIGIDVIEGKFNSHRALVGLLVMLAFSVVRFAYITVRRLWKTGREWGSFCSSEVYGVEFHADQFAVSYAGHTHAFQWNTVALWETPEFLVFTLDKSWACPLPMRVVPPDELPRLLAFVRERIPVVPEPPPPITHTLPFKPDDVAPTGD